MASERENNSGCSFGCSTPLGVLTLGLGLSIFGAAIGGGCSARIPLTEANVTLAGSVGSKDTSRQALPNYVQDRIATSKNFINSSTTLTIWIAEGTGVLIVGEQPGAPWVDINVGFANRDGKWGTESPIRYNPREVNP